MSVMCAVRSFSAGERVDEPCGLRKLTRCSFSDVLARHLRIHERNGDLAVLDGAKRRRHACQICSVAKARCDGKKPACGRCRARAIECVYPETSKVCTDFNITQNSREPIDML
jgi:hypothetical protein